MELFWYNIKAMDAAAYDAALSMMDAERRSRIGDFPNEDDRKRSAAGELLLRQAAAARLGCTVESAPLVWDENGKPGVEGDPFYVSVSHSGPYVVAAAGDHVLGVDVEVIRGAEEKFMRQGGPVQADGQGATAGAEPSPAAGGRGAGSHHAKRLRRHRSHAAVSEEEQPCIVSVLIWAAPTSPLAWWTTATTLSPRPAFPPEPSARRRKWWRICAAPCSL